MRERMEDVKQFSQRALSLLSRAEDDPLKSGRGRVVFHAFLLTLIIASFWTLDSLKDPVFEATVGMKFQPGPSYGASSLP